MPTFSRSPIDSRKYTAYRIASAGMTLLTLACSTGGDPAPEISGTAGTTNTGGSAGSSGGGGAGTGGNAGMGGPGCDLNLVNAAALPDPIGEGATLSGPTIVATDTGFIVGYREVTAAGDVGRVVLLPMDKEGVSE